jgi:transposase
MRKTREILRLTLGEGRSRHQVAVATGVPRTTVVECLNRAATAGLTWPLPEGMDDRALEGLLYRRPSFPPASLRPQPDWALVHRELHRKSVTLQLLWMEYKAVTPDGYQYTQFVHHYRRWAVHLDVVLRQDHRAGEKLFIDFAGQTVPIIDARTGVATPAELFVAVLGASNYTYAEVLPSQELPHWISAHVHTFEFLDGATEILVPDNLRSGVTRAHLYEPALNATYQEMAAHYGCAIIPARAGKPRDKAKAEQGVLLAERWLIASLRHHTFFSVAEANIAVVERLEWLNDRPFQKIAGTRRSLFEALDRPALRPLPVQSYEFATWKSATVNIDYHVDVDHHYYSVPYQLVRQRCETRLTATTVEAFHRGHRVASHPRRFQRGGYTTLPEHMPESHRRHLEWTPSRIVHWAQTNGHHTGALVDEILRSRPHPEQGFRSCLGIMRLGKKYGDDRLEAACMRALSIRALSYRSVESILRTGLDRQRLPSRPVLIAPLQHDFLRGAGYYT